MNSLPSPSLGYCFLFLCVFGPNSPANAAGGIVDTGNKMNGGDGVCTAQQHAARLQEGDVRCPECITNCTGGTQPQLFPWELVPTTPESLGEVFL